MQNAYFLCRSRIIEVLAASTGGILGDLGPGREYTHTHGVREGGGGGEGGRPSGRYGYIPLGPLSGCKLNRFVFKHF